MPNDCHSEQDVIISRFFEMLLNMRNIRTSCRCDADLSCIFLQVYTLNQHMKFVPDWTMYS